MLIEDLFQTLGHPCFKKIYLHFHLKEVNKNSRVVIKTQTNLNLIHQKSNTLLCKNNRPHFLTLLPLREEVVRNPKQLLCSNPSIR
jgi:pyridoxine 5'-phosphate synthase PdxJ